MPPHLTAHTATSLIACIAATSISTPLSASNAMTHSVVDISLTLILLANRAAASLIASTSATPRL
eukprot:CAMPEP_0181387108 /NCGR_PEP_ID=MMETSP1106-20121128/23528_1 /TAXON_ID=81844 /ORGANISM="Mantoniella antarctica, Strain SL-175" /LENGTH=64 /DNA_ID=CAMNT_0023507435 /DNA_START=367 /DNA_END=561 /DNA_ORIENTATION=+